MPRSRAVLFLKSISKYGVKWRSRDCHHCFKVFLFCLSTAVTSSCFLKPKKKSGAVRGSEAIVLRNDVFLDRIGEGERARLKFKTKIPSDCELALYSQDKTQEPKIESPRLIPCSKKETTHIEVIKDLRTETLYFIRLSAWSSDREKADVVVIQEQAGSRSGAPNTKFDEIHLVRLDRSLLSAEVSTESLAPPLKASDITDKIKRTVGCTQGETFPLGPFRDASPKNFADLSTKDFAQGRAEPHQDDSNRLKLLYNSFNEGLSRWTLIYERGGKDNTVYLRQGNQFLNIEMIAGETYVFSSPQLSKEVSALAISDETPLKVRWTTDRNLFQESYVHLQIGRPEEPTHIACVFAAKSGSGEVGVDLLTRLPEGKHVVIARLESSQFWASHGWLVAAYDFRTGRIEK
jgi:hypothetical protein